MALWSVDVIKQDLRDEFALHGEKNEDFVSDLLTEYADGLVPVYYSEIISEWQAMPEEFDGLGVVELGLPQDVSVYSLMSQDLWLYYSNAVREAWDELVAEAEADELAGVVRNG